MTHPAAPTVIAANSHSSRSAATASSNESSWYSDEQLVVVAEEQVDAILHQRPEVVAVTVDAERVRQGQRHHPPMGVGDLGGTPERRFGLVAVEQVALHVQHVRVGDDRLVDVVDAELARHTEIGVHRALGVRRDDDDAPPCRCAVFAGRDGGT